ncbi:hypothetical protein D351_02554 [Enterococcus faecalis WKS-26-18-2]|nr:hypothetical protein D351_02554 [Enterococcus faecalis WKS-26-18-2]
MSEENVVPIVEKVLLRFSPKLRSSSQLNPDNHYDWHEVTE